MQNLLYKYIHWFKYFYGGSFASPPPPIAYLNFTDFVFP